MKSTIHKKVQSGQTARCLSLGFRIFFDPRLSFIGAFRDLQIMPFADFVAGAIPRRVAGIAFALTWAGFTAAPAGANTIIDWNQQLIGVIQQTSALLINGPPEVAREMSILD